MIPLDQAFVFFSVSLALGLAPGPDNVFVLTQSALYGRIAGLLVTAGLCTGLLVHTTAVAFGVAVIFQTSELAFTGLKIVGCGYLLYLAWQAFRAGESELASGGEAGLTPRQLYVRGIIMNIANPKVAIFFLAFLPQFADPEQGGLIPQMLLLGALFIVATVLVFGAVAWGAGFLGERLRRSRAMQRFLNRMAGVVFLGLAVRLVVTER